MVITLIIIMMSTIIMILMLTNVEFYSSLYTKYFNRDHFNA